MADSEISRRLATIVALDVAGYSARTEADETASIVEIGGLRQTIDEIVRGHSGRVFNSAGDGFMLEFTSCNAAIEAAFALAEKCRPAVRIGVHLGDVAVQPNGDLLGHGVNVAARLMAQAGPGSGLVSAAVHETIHPRIRERLIPRGRLRLDKMHEAVDAFAFPSPETDAATPNDRFPPPITEQAGQPQKNHLAMMSMRPPHDKPSLAVMSFANLSNEPNQDYFTDGMMEEVITALGRIRSIFVMGSGTSLTLKGQSIGAPDAGLRLGVRYVLEGSVRRSGTKIRISVRLTDVSQGGAQIWGERFDGTLDDVFALQDQVALSVAGVIEPAVLAVEARRAARRPIESLDCYDLYLRAAALRATLHRTEVLEAMSLLDRALELEPNFAPALGMAASCHSLIVVNKWSDDVDHHRRQGLEVAQRAIRTAADDASVLAQTANALMELDSDVSRSRALIERALILNPSLAYAHFISGVISLSEADGAAAAQRFQEAAALDPLSSLGEMARVHVAVARILIGDLEEAVRIYRGTTYRTPRIHLIMAAAYGMLNNYEATRDELASYAAITTVPPETMIDQSTGNAKLRAWMLEGIERATST